MLYEPALVTLDANTCHNPPKRTTDGSLMAMIGCCTSPFARTVGPAVTQLKGGVSAGLSALGRVAGSSANAIADHPIIRTTTTAAIAKRFTVLPVVARQR